MSSDSASRPIQAPRPIPEQPLSSLSRRTFLQGAAAVGAGATVAVTAAGCGSADSHLSAVGKPVKGGPKTTPRTDIIYPEGYVGPIASHKGPVTTERATLTVVVPQDVQVGDWSKNEFSKWYEKRTNVHVNFKEVAGSTNSASNELMTKVNAIISSGDLPDVFMLPSPNNFSPSLLELYGRNQKLFIPLNDIIDQYCPETQRMFKEYPDTKQTYSLSDGKIYSMPNINDCFHCKAGNDRAWIYTPWLEKLGLKMPETLDEFEEVLKAFKNKDPNGNGKHDEIPFTVGANTTTFDQFIMGSFLYNPGQDGTTPWLVVDHGKIESVFDKDGWRQGLQYLNKLYKQGLIPKESFTRTNEQVLRLGNAKTPVLGAVRDYYWASFMDIIETGEHPRYKDYTCIPTLKGPNGFRTAAWNYYSPYGIGNFVITRSSKIPEIAGMWADGLYELESIIRNYAGVEGTEWRWARKGEKGINGKQALYSDITVWPPKPNRAWIQNAIMYRSDNFRLGQETDAKHPTFEKLLYEDTKSAYYPLREKQENQLPPLAMSADDAGDIADLQVTITNYVLQSMTKFIQGKPDPNSDSAWNNYLSTLKKMNLSKYLDVNQRAYDDRPK